MLDTILQYQYSGNAQIVYTFVRNQDKVRALRDMTFESAVEFIAKTKKDDVQQQSEPISPSDSAKSNNSMDENKELSEKAKGKLPKQVPIVQSSSGFQATPEWVGKC
jgi:hypothetical protein